MPGVTEDLSHGSDGDASRRPQGLEIIPFRGVRYAPERIADLAAVTSPPYDLIDARGVEQLMAAHPYNVVRLILPGQETDEPGRRYRRAAETLDHWLAEGVLATDREPALYIYEERSGDVVQRGVLGGVGLAPPEARIVLPHEDVMPGPVADRLQLMRATAANLEPIFLLYEGGGPASALVDEVAEAHTPMSVAVTEDGATHRVWHVRDPIEHARVAADLKNRRALIADGHHRYATYLRLQAEHHAAGHGRGPWDYGLALLVDSTAHPPRLGPIHRVLPDLPVAVAVERARAAFRVTSLSDDLSTALDALATAARRGPAFLLAGDGRHRLVSDPDRLLLEATIPADRSPLWRHLAATVLHFLLIPAVWRVNEDEHSVVAFHHDAKSACDAARQSGGSAVLLHPPGVKEVLALAEAGERVPRKSTSFGPKPRNGLLLRTFAAG